MDQRGRVSGPRFRSSGHDVVQSMEWPGSTETMPGRGQWMMFWFTTIVYGSCLLAVLFAQSDFASSGYSLTLSSLWTEMTDLGHVSHGTRMSIWRHVDTLVLHIFWDQTHTHVFDAERKTNEFKSTWCRLISDFRHILSCWPREDDESFQRQSAEGQSSFVQQINRHTSCARSSSSGTSSSFFCC